MAKGKDNRPVLASLLDRLTDEDPDRQQEVPPSARTLEEQLREGIRRDVEAFLNSRRRPVAMPEDLEAIRGTIVDYGIPDFLGQSMASDRQRRAFLREIVECVQAHEPRFKSVEIEPVGAIDQEDRSFRFRIHAVVHAEPAPESLSFDSEIELVSRTFDIKGA